MTNDVDEVCLRFGRGRVLKIAPLLGPIAAKIHSPFVALLPASNSEECSEAVLVAKNLVNMGCIELCCVGAQSEALHDALDGVLEDMSKLNVVTTFHEDVMDACEYFLFAAGAQTDSLLALVSLHPEFVYGLRKVLSEITLGDGAA